MLLLVVVVAVQRIQDQLRHPQSQNEASNRPGRPSSGPCGLQSDARAGPKT